MPPKKKKAAKKKATGDASAIELTPADKLIRAAMEIDALQRELAVKNDINARLKSQIMDSRAKIAVLEDSLKIKSNDQLELTSDMARQYKSMQSELLENVNHLDAENKTLEAKINTLQAHSKDQKKKYEATLAEKDALIEEQSTKMTYMTNEFEHMLNQTLSKMAKKLEVASSKWKEYDKTQLSEASQRRVTDFHLTRLKLGRMEAT